MSLYGEHVLPRLVHLSMRQETFEPYRRRVVTHASGRVLEIGVGSGLNLPFYEAATHVIGLGSLDEAPVDGPRRGRRDRQVG